MHESLNENLDENGADEFTNHIDQNSIGKEEDFGPGYSYEEIIVECESGDGDASGDDVHDVQDYKSRGIRRGKRRDPAPAVKSVTLGMGESIKFNMHVGV